MSSVRQPPSGDRLEARQHSEETQNIATAITEVSERATLLVREEIELAKAEITEKATKLVKGAVVGAAAGVFFLTALVFVLVGLRVAALLLPAVGNKFAYFWGFFAMAVILVVLGVLAGLIAAKAVKRGAPPVPTMAIEEAARSARRSARALLARGASEPIRPRRRGAELMAQRSPAEIRNSIEANRIELAVSVAAAARRGHAPDRLARARRAPPQRDDVGAAVVGLVIGGACCVAPPPAPRALAASRLRPAARAAARRRRSGRGRCRCRSPGRPRR